MVILNNLHHAQCCKIVHPFVNADSKGTAGKTGNSNKKTPIRKLAFPGPNYTFTH
jgi:hypothetical protein